MDINDFICNYELFVKVNDEIITHIGLNDINIAKKYFNEFKDEYINKTDKHVSIYIFDQNKNTNIEEYDNRD